MNEPTRTDGQTIARACALIRMVAAAGPGGIRLADLAAEAGLAKSTTHRLAKTLLDQGMLSYLPGTRRYSLSLELFAMAAVAANPESLQEVTRPSLMRLTSATGDSVFLMARTGFDVVCLDRIIGRHPLWTSPSNLGVGLQHPLGYSGSGMAVLSRLPFSEQEEVIRCNLEALQESCNTDYATLRQEMERGRSQGYVMCFPVREVNAAGIASAIVDKRGKAVGAICIAGRRERFTEERIDLILPLLRREIDTIQLQLNSLADVIGSADGLRCVNQSTTVLGDNSLLRQL